MSVPVLQTRRLTFSAFAMADAENVYFYASRPRVTQWLSWETHRSVEVARKFIQMVEGRPHDDHTWANRLRYDDGRRVVGAIDFARVGPDVADVHYVLAEHLWGQGLMTEAVSAVLAWGLARYPEIASVQTAPAAANVGSCRVLERCGFVAARRRLDRWRKYPDPVEVVDYVLRRRSRPPTS